MPRYIHQALAGLLLLATWPAAAQSGDSTQVKGRLWTRTARFVWQARRLPLAAPPEWNSTDEAEAWLKLHDPQNQSGMREMPNRVRTALKEQDVRPSQLAKAIRDETRKLDGIKSAALYADLRKLLAPPPAPATAVAAPTDTSRAVASSSPPTPMANAQAADTASATALPATGQPVPQPAAPGQSTGRNLPLTALIALAAAILGAVAGWWLRARWGRPDTEQLEDKIRTLKRKLQEEKNKSFQARPASASPDEPTAAARPPEPPAALPAPARTTAEAPPMEAGPVVLKEAEALPTPATTPRVFFASLREGGFLEDSQLRTEPSSHHALKITVDGRDLKKARFELNPAADQQTLIEYRLEVLREYFTFNLPAGRPSALTTRQLGRLAREADGWRVVAGHRGQLDVR